MNTEIDCRTSHQNSYHARRLKREQGTVWTQNPTAETNHLSFFHDKTAKTREELEPNVGMTAKTFVLICYPGRIAKKGHGMTWSIDKTNYQRSFPGKKHPGLATKKTGVHAALKPSMREAIKTYTMEIFLLLYYQGRTVKI